MNHTLGFPRAMLRACSILFLTGWCALFMAGFAQTDCEGESEHTHDVEHAASCMCICHHPVSIPEDLTAQTSAIDAEGRQALDNYVPIPEPMPSGIFRPPRSLV